MIIINGMWFTGAFDVMGVARASGKEPFNGKSGADLHKRVTPLAVLRDLVSSSCKEDNPVTVQIDRPVFFY